MVNRILRREEMTYPVTYYEENSFHRMRMKMPRLGGSYVAAGAFSKKTVR